MMMSPSDFLHLANKAGFSNGLFKQAMCQITANMLPYKDGPPSQIQSHHKQLYFRLSPDQSCIDYVTRTYNEVHESDQIHTAAFSLLKLIAD